MKYEARDHPESFFGGWDVHVGGRCPRRYLSMKQSEAEANIIAFALNAVADGFLLYAVRPDGLALADADLKYAGPTVGVAP